MKKLACAVLALCLVACGKSDDVKSTSSDVVQTPTRAVSITNEVEFAFNAEQFVAAFNIAAQSCGQPFHIHALDVKHGAVHDYFKQAFSEKTSLTVSISKETGRIISVTAVISGNPDSIDRATVVAISEVVAEATNPHLTQKHASALASEMLQESSTSDTNKFPQRFVNNVRYVLRSDSGIGYWWMANPV